MSFDFELTGTPPMLSDIVATRDKAVFDRAVFRKRNIRFMCGMAAVTTVYVTFILVVIFPLLENPEVGIIFYFFPHLTFVIFIVGNHLHIKRIEKPSNLLDKKIAGLNEMTPDEISSVVDDKEHPVEITSYMERVSAQGRALVRGEVDAIQKWHEANC